MACDADSSVVGVYIQLPNGKKYSLEELYICEHCETVLSNTELIDEFDSFYCMQCLEQMPLSEATVYGNRCAKCFECPNCFHGLQVRGKKAKDAVPSNSCENLMRSFSISQGISSSPPIKGFLFELFCEYCAWDSSHLNVLADRPEGLASLIIQKERESVWLNEVTRHVKGLRKLRSMLSRAMTMKSKMASYKVSSIMGFNTSTSLLPPDLDDGDVTPSPRNDELLELENQILHTEGYIKNYNIWESGTTASEALGKKLFGVSYLPTVNLASSVIRLTPGVDDTNQIPTRKCYTITEMIQSDDIIAEAEDVMKLLDSTSEPNTYASLEQKLRVPNKPATFIEDLMPTRKVLLSKRSYRCQKCQRLVLKSHLNPTAASLREKNNSALSFIPRIRLASYFRLNPDIKQTFSRIDLKFQRFNLDKRSICDIEFANFGYQNVRVNSNIDHAAAINPFTTLTAISDMNFSFKIPAMDETDEAEVLKNRSPSYGKPNTDDPKCVVYRYNQIVVIRIELEPTKAAKANSPAAFTLNLDISLGKQKIRVYPVLQLGQFEK